MNGWLITALLFGATLLVLVLVARERKKVWSALAAVTVLAFAGYVTQGRPELQSAPAQPVNAQLDTADALITMRADMDRNFGMAKKWLVPADSFARTGNYQLSAALIHAGLNEYPENGDLWAGLGLVLMLASDGELSEPAKLAFDRARKFAPYNAAPAYFEGLDALFKGKPADALMKWEALLQTAPEWAKWKAPLESQIKGLRRMMAGQ